MMRSEGRSLLHRAMAGLLALLIWNEFALAQSPEAEQAPVPRDEQSTLPEGEGAPEEASLSDEEDTPSSDLQGAETEATDVESTDVEPAADGGGAGAPAPGAAAEAEVSPPQVLPEPLPTVQETPEEPPEDERDFARESSHSNDEGSAFIELTPGGYFQTRLERTSFEHLGHVEPDAGDIYPSRFDVHVTIPRAAAYLEGSVHSPALTFRVQVGVDPGLALEDLYVNYAFAEAFQIRVGKDKRPFSRQFLTRRNHLQFSDLSPVERYFAIDRDVGVLLHNDYLHTTGFEYALGVYQGKHTVTYDTIPFRDDEPFVQRVVTDDTADSIEPTVVFRLGFNNGPNSYRESAWGSNKYQYGVGLSGLMDLNTNRSGAARAEVELDAIFKVGGFSISSMLAMKLGQTGDDFFKNRDQGGAATSLQMGYVIAQRVEPVIRLSAAMMGEVNYDALSMMESESAAGFNVYFFGHDLKWTNEFSLTRWSEVYGQPEDKIVRRTFFRSQLQFGFRGI